MKTINTVLLAFVLLFAASCTKQAGKSSAKMNGIEFTKTYGFQLPFLDYTSGSALARGKKTKAADAQLTVREDLQLTNPSGNNFHSTASEDAEWFAFQNLTDGTAFCPANWSGAPVPDPNGQDCNIPIATGTTKVIRTFTSDEGVTGVQYDIHLSNPITKTGE